MKIDIEKHTAEVQRRIDIKHLYIEYFQSLDSICINNISHELQKKIEIDTF